MSLHTQGDSQTGNIAFFFKIDMLQEEEAKEEPAVSLTV